jgi:peptidoglycan glycosyltransferase
MEAALALQRLAALVLLALVVLPLAGVKRPAGAPPTPRPLAAFASAVGVVFALTFLCQAWWTLLPDLSPGWRSCRRFDSRAFRLRTLSDRRGLCDRYGLPLAVNVWDHERVVRRYPLGRLAAHVTGYHHPRFGQAGAEAACTEDLATWRRPAWDVLGRLRQNGDTSLPPLRLTLDSRLQTVAAKALGDRRGAVVVLSPSHGDVLALVSAPSFQPDALSPADFALGGTDRQSPLFDRAVQGLYPPGSTLKPLVVAAALAAGIGPETRHETPPEGFLADGDHLYIRDHEASEAAHNGREWAGHGVIDMRAALTCSSNVYFAWLGTRLGGEAFLNAAHTAGLDEAWPLIDRPHAAGDLTSPPGRFPSPPLTPATLARCAIGQDEVLVTPLHMALLTATIANRGVLMAPRLRLDQSVGEGRVVMTEPVARATAELMRAPVADAGGTAAGLRMAVAVAGKTGSAENSAGAPHAWVIAFAPTDAPRLAIAVLVENGGMGSKAAVPIARAILEAADAAGYFPHPAAPRSKPPKPKAKAKGGKP